MAVLAELFLRKTPEGTILYDLRASRVVPEYIRELGGHPVKTRVGHSCIKEKMREVDAVFAGELAGHYYYRELGFTDSGIFLRESHTEPVVRLVIEAEDERTLQYEKARLLDIVQDYREESRGPL
jgi:phosphomannomutase